jgi:hypothetical protein
VAVGGAEDLGEFWYLRQNVVPTAFSQRTESLCFVKDDLVLERRPLRLEH